MPTIQRTGIGFAVRYRDEPGGPRRTRSFASCAEAEAFAETKPNSRPWGGTYRDPRERVHGKVDIDSNGCWLWRGTVQNAGYGALTVQTPEGPKTRLAHRFSYEAFVGGIPQGLQLDHLCRVRHCVNPEHLEPVTQRENVLRSPIAMATLNAAKTECPHGHAYDEANTYLYRGGRICKACQHNHYLRRNQAS